MYNQYNFIFLFLFFFKLLLIIYFTYISCQKQGFILIHRKIFRIMSLVFYVINQWKGGIQLMIHLTNTLYMLPIVLGLFVAVLEENSLTENYLSVGMIRKTDEHTDDW